MRAVTLRRKIILLVLLLLTPPLGFVGWDWGTSNFGVIQAGRIYRSGQMTAGTLTRTIADHGLKTILNLRGANLEQPWYRVERAATTAAGATQIDVKMASDMWLARDQIRGLVRVFDTAQYPLLIHCEFGSERTGLVSAIATLLRPGGTLEEARGQFSIRYLYYKDRSNKVLPAHLDQYEAWLLRQGTPHSPDRFRRWVAEGYKPGGVSREDWPHNPDPVVVITPPPAHEAAVGSRPGNERR